MILGNSDIAKKCILDWLQAKKRTDEEIAEKIMMCMNSALEAGEKREEENDLRKIALKAIFAPVRTGYE